MTTAREIMRAGATNVGEHADFLNTLPEHALARFVKALSAQAAISSR